MLRECFCLIRVPVDLPAVFKEYYRFPLERDCPLTDTSGLYVFFTETQDWKPGEHCTSKRRWIYVGCSRRLRSRILEHRDFCTENYDGVLWVSVAEYPYFFARESVNHAIDRESIGMYENALILTFTPLKNCYVDDSYCSWLRKSCFDFPDVLHTWFYDQITENLAFFKAMLPLNIYYRQAKGELIADDELERLNQVVDFLSGESFRDASFCEQWMAYQKRSRTRYEMLSFIDECQTILRKLSAEVQAQLEAVEEKKIEIEKILSRH